MTDTEAEQAAALYDPENLEPLGARAFVHCGSPLKRWTQITQEERRAWMQGAGFGFADGKAEGERKPKAKR